MTLNISFSNLETVLSGNVEGFFYIPLKRLVIHALRADALRQATRDKVYGLRTIDAYSPSSLRKVC